MACRYSKSGGGTAELEVNKFRRSAFFSFAFTFGARRHAMTEETKDVVMTPAAPIQTSSRYSKEVPAACRRVSLTHTLMIPAATSRQLTAARLTVVDCVVQVVHFVFVLFVFLRLQPTVSKPFVYGTAAWWLGKTVQDEQSHRCVHRASTSA
jgi:hypothetical protein